MSGHDVIKELISNSETFKQKTEYSQVRCLRDWHQVGLVYRTIPYRELSSGARYRALSDLSAGVPMTAFEMSAGGNGEASGTAPQVMMSCANSQSGGVLRAQSGYNLQHSGTNV